MCLRSVRLGARHVGYILNDMKRYILPAVFFFALVVVPTVALAQTGSSGNTPPTGSSGNTISGGLTQAEVKNPLGVKSFCGLVKALLRAAIQIGIPVAVLFIVWAGFKFVLAQGKSEDLVKARKNFMWTLIGIAIFLGAWLLANVVANTVNALGGGQQIISCQ